MSSDNTHTHIEENEKVPHIYSIKEGIYVQIIDQYLTILMFQEDPEYVVYKIMFQIKNILQYLNSSTSNINLFLSFQNMLRLIYNIIKPHILEQSIEFQHHEDLFNAHIDFKQIYDDIQQKLAHYKIECVDQKIYSCVNRADSIYWQIHHISDHYLEMFFIFKNLDIFPRKNQIIDFENEEMRDLLDKNEKYNKIIQRNGFFSGAFGAMISLTEWIEIWKDMEGDSLWEAAFIKSQSFEQFANKYDDDDISRDKWEDEVYMDSITEYMKRLEIMRNYISYSEVDESGCGDEEHLIVTDDGTEMMDSFGERKNNFHLIRICGDTMNFGIFEFQLIGRELTSNLRSYLSKDIIDVISIYCAGKDEGAHILMETLQHFVNTHDNI